MAKTDSLGGRMKQYENCFKPSLPGRMPIILRIDGKAFHTYTKSLKNNSGIAYNKKLEEVMNLTALKLCEEIQGAQLAYIQSDEISILVHGYKKLNSQGWFNNELIKMVSVSAAIASATFTVNSYKIWSQDFQSADFDDFKPAYFDSRAFVLPEAEVCNYFVWRQQDSTRNSIQMLARSLYSHKECNMKNASQLQEMCWQKGRNWNDEPVPFKRGRCALKSPKKKVLPDGKVIARPAWAIDNNIPVFSQKRKYIEDHLLLDEEQKEVR